MAIAKSVSATINAFVIKPPLEIAKERALREVTYLAYQLANNPIDDISPRAILRAFAYLGAAYLESVGEEEIAIEALRGIEPLVAFLKGEKE